MVLRVYAIIFDMCPNEFHVHRLKTVNYGNDQPVIIAFDIEDNTPVLQDAGISVFNLDVCGLYPRRFFDFIDPRLQRLFRVRVRIPEITENLDGNQFHVVENSPTMGLCQPGMIRLPFFDTPLYPIGMREHKRKTA